MIKVGDLVKIEEPLLEKERGLWLVVGSGVPMSSLVQLKKGNIFLWRPFWALIKV